MIETIILYKVRQLYISHVSGSLESLCEVFSCKESFVFVLSYSIDHPMWKILCSFTVLLCPSTVGSFLQNSFTQDDLNQHNIRYILNPSLEVTSDSFEFQVSDMAGNTIVSEM